MQGYVHAGYQLILLHRRNKRPMALRWTKTETNPAEVLAQAERDGLNIGVRLRQLTSLMPIRATIGKAAIAWPNWPVIWA